jgi:hypothetical protein
MQRHTLHMHAQDIQHVAEARANFKFSEIFFILVLFPLIVEMGEVLRKF